MKIFSAQLKGTTIVVSGSSASITGSFTGSIAGIDINETNQFTASTIARLSSIETISSSNDSRVNSLEAFSSSIFTTNTFTSSTSARLNALEITSASVDTLNSNQNTRLNSLEDKTGSLATTGSNIFYGTQTFTGSVYIRENLIVQGSSSLQNITASAVDIGTNKIILNVDNPAVRFAGISVYDSGSTQGTGSLWWDSTQNHWLYEHPSDSAAPYNSAILISGPKNVGNLGEELELVNNYIVKAVGGDHISSSAIYDDGTKVTMYNDTLIISSSGNVGIGIPLPLTKLNIGGNNNALGSNNTLRFTDTDSATEANQQIGKIEFYSCDTTTPGPGVKAYIGAFAQDSSPDGYLSFATQDGSGTPNPIERLRITSEGNIGIGTSTPSNIVEVAKAAQDSMVILTESSDNGDCTALFYARRSRGTSLTSPTVIQSQNNLGGIAMGGYDGSSYKIGAKIVAAASETWSTGCNGTDIIFSTNSTTKCLPTEKVRINASGLVNFACNICVNTKITIVDGGNSIYAWSSCITSQPGLYAQICIGSGMTGVYNKMYGPGVNAGLFGLSSTECMAFVGTDGACGKGMLIGTANNAPIYVGTNNIEAFRITTNQYLLLGSTQNSYKLEVTAPANTNASYFKAGGTSGYAAIAFSGDGGQAIGVLSTVSNNTIYLGTANGTIGNQFGTNGEFAIQKGSNTTILKLMCTGVSCFAGAICVNEAVYVAGSFPGVKLDRAGTTAQSDINWKNAGTSVWSIGTAVKAVGSNLDFYSYSISDNVMRFTQAGIVTKPYQPSFLAYGMGNTTLGSYVIYPSVHLNKGSHYNASTGVFTAPVAGVYYFSWSSIGNTPNSIYRWFLRINDTNFLGDYHLRQDTNETGLAYASNGNRDVIINLAANDTVRIYFASDASELPYGVNGTTDSYLNFMGYLLG